jgi:hypothetical protein
LRALFHRAQEMALPTNRMLTALAVLALPLFGGPGRELVAAPAPKAGPDPGVIWMFRPAEGDLVGYSPEGKKIRTVRLAARGLYWQAFLGITRDGRRALVAARKGIPPAGREAGYRALHAGTLTVHLWPLSRGGKPTDTGIGCQSRSRYVVSRDGKTLIVDHDRSPRNAAGVPEFPIRYETVAYDLATFKGTRRPALPDGFTLADELPNGDQVLMRYAHKEEPHTSFHLLRRGGKKLLPLTGKAETDSCQLSPDGSKLLVTRWRATKSKPGDSNSLLYVVDRATGRARRFAAHDNTGWARAWWSPDGKRIVYEWDEVGQLPAAELIGSTIRPTPIRRRQVVVCDADGRNAKAIVELAGNADEDLIRFQEWSFARPRVVGWYPAR